MKFTIYGSLGDEIAVTGLVREFHNQYPKERIEVSCKFPELFTYNPYLNVGEYVNNIEYFIPLGDFKESKGNLVHTYAKRINLKVINSDPEIFLSKDEENLFHIQDTIAIDTWAGWPSRRWNIDKFYRLVDLIKNKYKWVKIIEIGKSVPDVFQKYPQYFLTNVHERYDDKLSIRETAALLRKCRLYIGSDSGLFHLAASVKTKQIALFTVPWYRRAYSNTFPIFNSLVDCDECTPVCKYENSCLEGIEPEDVLKVIDWYL